VVVVLFSLILECRSNARLRRGGAALLLLLWLVAATLLTFLGPFTTTGNGFFACWGGLLCAFAFTWHEGGLGAAEPPPAAPARARSNSITAAAAAAASKIAAAGPQRLQLVCLGSASVVVLASAVPAAGVGDGLGDYALCVGAVSLCAVGFVLGALRACAPLLDKRNKGPQRLTLRQARSLRRPAGPPGPPPSSSATSANACPGFDPFQPPFFLGPLRTPPRSGSPASLSSGGSSPRASSPSLAPSPPPPTATPPAGAGCSAPATLRAPRGPTAWGRR
jgi:hypothetical protein